MFFSNIKVDEDASSLVPCHQDIWRFDISVADSLIVQVLYTFEHLLEKLLGVALTVGPWVGDLVQNFW